MKILISDELKGMLLPFGVIAVFIILVVIFGSAIEKHMIMFGEHLLSFKLNVETIESLREYDSEMIKRLSLDAVQMFIFASIFIILFVVMTVVYLAKNITIVRD